MLDHSGDANNVVTDAVWTAEKPTAAGWYWWRDLPSAEAQPVKVLAYADGSAMPHCDYGEWQGPLTPNEATA